jgi:predicted GNAT family acetyltransferase
MAELGAFFGNPNIQRQGARARALAGQRDVNTLPDPLTYAVMQGLLGTRPDEMGFSVLNPDYEKIKKVAEPAFALGLLGQAAPVLAPLTKGLPVGASIKNVGKFDVVKRDASDIFGEGAQRIRYTDPKSSGSIEVLARQDGTASVLSLEVPEKFRGKKIGESLQKQVLEDFPDMQGQVSSKAAATTAYRIGRRPVDMPDATLKDVHKMIDEDSSVNMISPQMQQRISPSASYPQQEALDTAQRNAALPKEQYGLGLPPDNTPEMRAAAMNMEKRGFSETEGKNIEEGLLSFDTRRVGAAASDEQTPYAMFIKPSGQGIGIAKNQPAQMPLYVKSNQTDENILRSFSDRAELQQYLNQFPEIRDATKAVRDLDNQMANYMEELTKKADALDAQGKTVEADKILNSMNFDSPLMKEFDARTNELAAIAKEKITDLFNQQQVGTVGLRNDQGAFGRNTITEMVLNPNENVRSAFAAFDPFRRTAAIAAATGMAAPDLMAQEIDYSLIPTEKRKQILSLLE